MPQIYLDSIKDSEYEEDETGIRYARGFHSAALDVSLPADILRKAIITSPGMPQRGEGHPTIGNCVVVGYRIRFNTTANIASGAVLYKTPTSPTGANSNGWTYTERGSLETITASKLPFADIRGIPGALNVIVQGKTGKNANGTDIVVTKPAAFQYHRPLRTVSFSIVRASEAPDEWKAAIGALNEDTFKKLGPGFWIILDVGEATTNAGGSYVVTVTVQSRVTEDWSTSDVFRDANGPRAIPDAEVDRLFKIPYPAQLIPSQMIGDGITRILPYRTVNFANTFQL